MNMMLFLYLMKLQLVSDVLEIVFVSDLVLPDIIVLGKALTAGYIGHAVTVANHKIYNGFYSDKDTDALMHGPTFMEIRSHAVQH